MSDNANISSPVRPTRLTDLANAADEQSPPKGQPAPSAEPHITSLPSVGVSPRGELAVARRRFAILLGEFRRAAVLVPLDASDSLWTADRDGVRWICAFSDEEALAVFARAQGGAGREWTYQRVLGARLLDVMVPLLPGPGGVALDVGSPDGMLFPPVRGVVPDAVAVDLEGVR
ncbi:SseB family protein [Streptomyces sp. PvR034]|uniref:SseB family protein n=1 Tax=Streptomyces sp. PvR034 TaxID=3156401 RepID=UPI00339A5D7E